MPQISAEPVLVIFFVFLEVSNFTQKDKSRNASNRRTNSTSDKTAILLHPWTGLEDSRMFRLPDFKTIGMGGGSNVIIPTQRPSLR